MTNLIDDIKRDREAGTSGPFYIGGDHGGGLVHHVYSDDTTGSRVADCECIAVPKQTIDANARRIANVPAMEDALLAAVTVLTECREVCLFDDDDGIGVSEDVVIPSDLFDRICAAIDCKALEAGQ